MDFKKLCLILCWVSCSLILTGCNQERHFQYDIIQIKGVEWVSNVSYTYGSFGSIAESEELPEVYLAVSEGDLLYLTIEDSEFYYRYQPEDGKELVITVDSTMEGSVFVNGTLKFLELSGEPSSWELLEELTKPEIDQLSVLAVTDFLSQDHLEVLRSIESSLHGIGLVVETEIDEQKLADLLSICRPHWLMMESPCKSTDAEVGQALSNLELLWVQGDINTVSHTARCCPNLETLIIAEWDPQPGELFALTNLRNLHTLTLAECGITDLTQIEFPGSLRQLHMILCDTLSDISSLSELPALYSLTLSGSDDIEDLGAVTLLESLKRISLPSNTTQSDFEKVLAGLPSLEVVEMIDCPGVEDLLPLQKMTELKILATDLDESHLSELETLSQLDLIVLSSDIFEEYPDRIAELRSSLPGTTIVPGSGICLGSGWLLLIIPMIWAARFILRIKS